MKIAAILTGKANSSFKNKNIKRIKNKFIFSYPCAEAKKVKQINKFYTSSDSKIILDNTKNIGFSIIKRPKFLAQKNSKHRDALIHALKKINKDNFYPDILVVLLANAPIIKSTWIDESLRIIQKNKSITAVVPAQKNNDHHPQRAKRLKNGFLKNFIDKKNASTNRQDLEQCYFLCHNFWVIRTKEIYKNSGYSPWKFMGKNVKPYLIKDSIDIHNNLDLEIARSIIKNDEYFKKA